MSLHIPRRHLPILIVFGALLLLTMAAAAQTNTPVPPTAIPAPSLNVPTDQFFDQANGWIVVFAPILAIGVGIAVALAILRFVGKQIIDAF